jgi:hypothetical protein
MSQHLESRFRFARALGRSARAELRALRHCARARNRALRPARRLRGPIAWLVFGVLLAFAPRAHAHPDLDEAKQLVGDLEFDAALASFGKALTSGTLTHEELVTLLSERAFVYHALRRQEELIDDFIWLSALDPDHRLDMRAPPDMTAIWTSVRDQGRGALRVELSAQRNDEGEVDARASLSGTVPEGARARLWLRRGQGEFELAPGAAFHERPSSELAFYADGLLLGGVLLPGANSAQNPLRVPHESGDRAKEVRDESWARRHKGWLIGGAALIVGAVVVTAVLLTRPEGGNSDKTNINPMVTF